MKKSSPKWWFDGDESHGRNETKKNASTIVIYYEK